MTGVVPSFWIGTPDCADSLDEAALAPDARETLASLATDSRRRDWRASRALLQRAAPAGGATVSLSHSRGYAAVLVGAQGTRVGVDLETTARRRWGALATFAFAPEEARALAALDGDTCRREFLIRWTLKEAFTKALGIPLTVALRDCVIRRDAAGRWSGVVPAAEPWHACVYEGFDECVVAAVVVGGAATAPPAPTPWPDAPVVEIARFSRAD